MNITIYPADILRQKTIPVENFTKAKDLAYEMLSVMEKSSGIGLAAPQIGENLSLFVASVTGKAKDGLIFINPTIVDVFGKEVVAPEGCLSLPGQTINVKRWDSLRIQATNERGETDVYKAGGLLARIIQHEVDHLFGVLIIDYVKPELSTPNGF